MSLRVKYDKSIKIAGIGQTPWQRYGPQAWFSDYRIVAQSDSPVSEKAFGSEFYIMPDNIVDKTGRSRDALKQIVDSDWFNNLCSNELKNYKFLAYKPVKTKNGVQIIANDTTYSDKYENKANFREHFKKKVKFPKFEILDLKDLGELGFEKLQDKWDEFVVQDELMSSGTGTFIIRNKSEFDIAFRKLKDCGSVRVVVSEKISGQDISVQCCLSKYGTFIGPLQRQFIDHSRLSNRELKGVEKFNGVYIGEEVDGKIIESVKKQVKIIAEVLAADNYKGIFSVDLFLETTTNEVYVLEINPRMTGVTPAYNIVQSSADIPMPLIHILEVGGFEYTISDFKISDLDVDLPQTSLVILRSKFSKSVTIKVAIESGQYTSEGEISSRELMFGVDKGLVQSYVSEGTVLKPGDKIASIYFKGQQFIDNNELKSLSSKIVDYLYSRIEHEALSD